MKSRFLPHFRCGGAIFLGSGGMDICSTLGYSKCARVVS